MSRFYSYLNTAKGIIANYQGEMPLNIHLKQFFTQEKKYGSKDRKQIAALCFPYYRASKALTCNNIDEKILYSYFLCENKSSALLAFFKPDLDEKIALPLNEKILLLNDVLKEEILFPFENELSETIHFSAFNTSILTQPKLYIRTRPLKNKLIENTLIENNISFNTIHSNTFSLDNGTQIPDTLVPDQDYVVQDVSSQRVINVIEKFISELPQNATVWDCCAASGGKSLMLYDARPDLYFTVSDVRESILVNLKERFNKAGLKKYSKFVLDLNSMHGEKPSQKFDVVLADVPCTGSGTWARTPEQQYFFNEEQIQKFVKIQQKITLNASKFVKPKGYLVYITCSVFKAENEDNVTFLQENGFELLDQQYNLGYTENADTLFVAVLKKV